MESTRTAFVSNALGAPPEEGSRRTAHEVAVRIHANSDCLAFGPKGSPGWVIPLADGSLPGYSLINAIRSYTPDRVVLCPYTGLSRRGWMWLDILAAAVPKARFVVLVLQPFAPSTLARLTTKALGDRLVILGASRDCTQSALDVGARAADLVLGVDTDVFSPVNQSARLEARRRYGFAPDSRIVVHVGHATPGRCLDRIASLADKGYEVVFVLSSTTQWGDNDAAPIGDRIHTFVGYRDDIADLYRMADVYAFCVKDVPLSARQPQRSAIGTPLSVLESLACGTPVATTRFGRLTELLADRSDVVFLDDADDESGLHTAVDSLLGTRADGVARCWDDVVEEVMQV